MPAGPAPTMTTSRGAAVRGRFAIDTHRLSPLLGGLADQSHAAQLSRDENSGNVGLEVGLHQRNVDAAPLAAVDERDRADRARGGARTVTDARGGIRELRFAVNDPQCLLGADLRARTGPNADHRIDDGMQRHRLRQSAFDGSVEVPSIAGFEPATARDVHRDDCNERKRVERVGEKRVFVHGGSASMVAPQFGIDGEECSGNSDAAQLRRRRSPIRR